MQHKIKSDLVISHCSLVRSFFAVLNSYTSQPFSIAVNFDATEKDNEGVGNRSAIVCSAWRYLRMWCQLDFSIHYPSKSNSTGYVATPNCFLFHSTVQTVFYYSSTRLKVIIMGWFDLRKMCVWLELKFSIHLASFRVVVDGDGEGKTFPSRAPSEHAIKNRDLSEIHLTNWNASGNWNHNRQLDSARCRFNKY